MFVDSSPFLPCAQNSARTTRLTRTKHHSMIRDKNAQDKPKMSPPRHITAIMPLPLVKETGIDKEKRII